MTSIEDRFLERLWWRSSDCLATTNERLLRWSSRTTSFEWSFDHWSPIHRLNRERMRSDQADLYLGRMFGDDRSVLYMFDLLLQHTLPPRNASTRVIEFPRLSHPSSSSSSIQTDRRIDFHQRRSRRLDSSFHRTNLDREKRRLTRIWKRIPDVKIEHFSDRKSTTPMEVNKEEQQQQQQQRRREIHIWSLLRREEGFLEEISVLSLFSTDERFTQRWKSETIAIPFSRETTLQWREQMFNVFTLQSTFERSFLLVTKTDLSLAEWTVSITDSLS